jgi:WD40 repeat protein
MRQSAIANLWLVIPLIALFLVASRNLSAQEPKERAVLKGHGEAAYHLAFSPDGKTLASCGEPRIKVWDVKTGNEVITLNAPEGIRRARAVAYSPDGKTLAFMWNGGTIQLWDTMKKGEPITLATTGGGKAGLAYLSDGRLVASAAKNVTIWDVATGKEVAVLTGHTKTIQGIAASPDDKTLVSAGEDGTVRLWDVGTRKQRAVLEGHKQAVWAVAISPDGKTVASGSVDGVIKFWDAGTGEVRATMKGHGQEVTALAFTPDGETLASTGYDNRLRLWNTATYKERVAIKVPGDAVWGVTITRDGRTMATGNEDGIIRLWDIAVAKK